MRPPAFGPGPAERPLADRLREPEPLGEAARQRLAGEQAAVLTLSFLVAILLAVCVAVIAAGGLDEVIVVLLLLLAMTLALVIGTGLLAGDLDYSPLTLTVLLPLTFASVLGVGLVVPLALCWHAGRRLKREGDGRIERRERLPQR